MSRPVWHRVVLVSSFFLLPCPFFLRAAEDDLESARARVRAAEGARVDLVRRVEPSVVVIFPTEQPGGGSGVLISPDGYVLTNYHVILEALAGASVRKVRVGLPGGTIREGTVVGVDPVGDLALVRVKAGAGVPPCPWARLGDSEALRVGDWTLAMGNPFLLASDFRPTVTLGVVSGLHRYLPGSPVLDGNQQSLTYADAIQMDTSVNPGNSGGPLFNLAGEVVGVNGRISTRERGRMNIGVGFAIPTSLVRRFLPDLRAGKICRHGSLGATVRDEEGAVVIGETYVDSPVKKAGMRLGDAILSFDGVSIRSQNEMLNLVVSRPAGWEVPVRYRRDGKEQVALVVLEAVEVKERYSFLADPEHLKWERDRILARAGASAGPAWKSFEASGTASGRDGKAVPVRIRRVPGRVAVETLGENGAPGGGYGVSRMDAWPLRGGDLGARADDLIEDLLALEAIEAGREPKGGTAVFSGGGRSQGEVADAIEISFEGGRRRLALLSGEGRLLEERYESHAGLPVRIRRGDFRKVGDREVPFRIETEAGGVLLRRIIVEKAAFDVPTEGWPTEPPKGAP